MKLKVVLSLIGTIGIMNSSFAQGGRLCGNRMIHNFLDRIGYDNSNENYQTEFKKAQDNCNYYVRSAERVYTRVTGYSGRYWNSRFKRRLVLDRLYEDINYYEMVNEIEEKYAEGVVKKVYKCVLNREPDSSGMRTYTRKILRGDGYWGIRDDIGSSEEAKSKINELYRELLFREADAGGLRHYSKRLRKKSCLNNIRVDIIDSDEYRGKH